MSEELKACPFRIGDEVAVIPDCDDWASDWADLRLWVAAVHAVPGGGFEYWISDEWPLPAKPSLTDGFYVGVPSEQDSLTLAASRTPTEAEPGEAEVERVARAMAATDLRSPRTAFHGPTKQRYESLARAAIAARRFTPNAVDGQRYWILLHEPGCTPERKGSFDGDMAKTIREFIEARPTAYIDVLTIDSLGVPEVAHGPEMLQMLDGRSMSTGRKHNERTRAAHAPYHTPAVAVDDDAEWLRTLNATYGFPADTQARLTAIAHRLQSLQASVRVRDEALREALKIVEAERAVMFDSNVQLGGKYKGQVIDTLAVKDIAEMDRALAAGRAALSDQHGGASTTQHGDKG